MKTDSLIVLIEIKGAYNKLLWTHFLLDGIRLIGVILVGVLIYSFI